MAITTSNSIKVKAQALWPNRPGRVEGKLALSNRVPPDRPSLAWRFALFTLANWRQMTQNTSGLENFAVI